MRAFSLSAVVVLVTVASLSAQTLAEIAKKEEERRKQTPPAGKVYTNKDLGAVPPAPISPPSGDAKADGAKDGEKGASGATGGTGDKAAADKDKKPGEIKDQKYWHDRYAKALEVVDRDQTLAEAMQSRINALTTDFVNRDDPAQRAIIARDRDRALAELERLKKAIVDGRKSISDIEDEARRAGVPPGWLR